MPWQAKQQWIKKILENNQPKQQPNIYYYKNLNDKTAKESQEDEKKIKKNYFENAICTDGINSLIVFKQQYIFTFLQKVEYQISLSSSF